MVFILEIKSTKRISLSRIISKLIQTAIADTFLAAWPMDHKIKHYREKGLPLPDNCKPGYVIKSLPQEEREILKLCTSEDFNHWRVLFDGRARK